MKEPAVRPFICTEMVKVVLAAMFSAGLGEVMIAEIMLDVEGILPMTVYLVRSDCFLFEIEKERMSLPMPLQDPVFTCKPLVRVWPEQKLMKFAVSLD